MSVHWTSPCAGDQRTPSPSSFFPSTTISGRGDIAQSAPVVRRLSALTAPRRVFSSSRRALEASVGRVARRGFGRSCAFVMQRRKTRAGVLAVARLARELLGEDDDHAILGRSRAGELDEADRDIVRQARRAPDVEPELDRARYLVDILPARTRRTDEAFDDLALVNEQIADFHASTGLAAHRRASTNAWKLRDLLSARSRCGPIRLANSICPPKAILVLNSRLA